MSHPAAQNLRLLQQGLDVLQELPEFLYTETVPEYFTGSVGKHIRHILNFYECFLNGISSGRIDYDARHRDVMVETSPMTAQARMRAVKKTLSTLEAHQCSEDVLVHQNEGDIEDPENDWSRSTVGREIQSLVSHTVHHYAIIALILRILGFECPRDFGVAPSTLKYQRSLECVPSRG